MSEAAFEIRTIAVIGAGPAGRAFAFRCARAGFGVVLEDVMPSNLRRAQDEYAEYVQLAESASGSLNYASTVEDAVRDADLAFDFVPDELESKLEIFSMMDRMAPPRTVLCTPTMALNITDLASCTYRAERCIALASSVPDMFGSTIVVVRSRWVLDSVAEAVAEFLRALGMSATFIADREEPMLVKNVRPT